MNQAFFTPNDALGYLSRNYGTQDLSKWQSLRKSFYSYRSYAEAGAASFSFFGDTLGQGSVTAQLTNMPRGGSFGSNQHFLIKAIRTKFYIKTWDLTAWDGTHTSTLYSDLVAGFAQAGVLSLKINNSVYHEIPKPFLYCSSGDAQPQIRFAGLDTLTLTEGTPNTLLTSRSAPPFATLASRNQNGYLVDPNLLIVADQQFELSIEYPSGVIPVLGTGVTDDSTNPLYIGVELDGVLFRTVN